MRPFPPLVDRLVPAADVPAREGAAAGWPRLALDAGAAADLALLAIGAYSPLTGFLGSADAAAVAADATLADGTCWPVPILLAAEPAAARASLAAGRALLVGPDGTAHGEIEVAELFEAPDGTTCVAGPIHGYGRGPAPCPAHARSPAAVRATIAARGWAAIAGHVPVGLPDRATEHAQKAALEVADGLIALAPVDEADDPTPDVRLRALDRLLAAYYPPGRVELAALAAPPRPPDARTAALEALVLRNYACTHVVLAPATAAAVRALLAPHLPGLGLTLLGGDAAFFCRDCGATATARTCPHMPMARVAPTSDQLRRVLGTGHPPPPEVMRPEVAAVLVAALREPGTAPAEAAEVATATVPPPAPSGRTVWLTGRPAAGKTTIALALAAAMRARGRKVEVLDADDALADLAAAAPTDRDGHLAADRRLAWAAAALNRHGVDAVVAAVAPFAEGREAARDLLGEVAEVYVSCPMERCAARDPKGLYRQAFAGELAGLPGVDAPFEPPEAPDLELRTDLEDVETCVERILALIGV